MAGVLTSLYYWYGNNNYGDMAGVLSSCDMALHGPGAGFFR